MKALLSPLLLHTGRVSSSLAAWRKTPFPPRSPTMHCSSVLQSFLLSGSYQKTRLLGDKSAAGRTRNFSSKGATAGVPLRACFSDVAVRVWSCNFEAPWMIITPHRTETSFLCLRGASMTRKKRGAPGSGLDRVSLPEPRELSLGGVGTFWESEEFGSKSLDKTVWLSGVLVLSAESVLPK